MILWPARCWVRANFGSLFQISTVTVQRAHSQLYCPATSKTSSMPASLDPCRPCPGRRSVRHLLLHGFGSWLLLTVYALQYASRQGPIYGGVGSTESGETHSASEDHVGPNQSPYEQPRREEALETSNESRLYMPRECLFAITSFVAVDSLTSDPACPQCLWSSAEVCLHETCQAWAHQRHAPSSREVQIFCQTVEFEPFLE